jgi:hypothetical protein
VTILVSVEQVEGRLAGAGGLGSKRQRYFTINWIQFATTWSAFDLFLVALISVNQWRRDHLQADPRWRQFTSSHLDRAKWRNRKAIATWTTAMLTTGESADVLNRLAMVNEGVSGVQAHLRVQSGPANVTEEWTNWLAEAISVREDLVLASRRDIAEWLPFRAVVGPEHRAELERRRKAGDTADAVRKTLAVPLQLPRQPAKLGRTGAVRRRLDQHDPGGAEVGGDPADQLADRTSTGDQHCRAGHVPGLSRKRCFRRVGQ